MGLRAGGAITNVSSKLSVVSGFESVVSSPKNKEIPLEYGNLCRAFSEDELRNFFKCCKNPRAFLAFK